MFVQVDSVNIKVGMFVAELDRPWLDTPYLLQGFRVDSQEEVVRLGGYCRYVIVDTTRSASGLFAEPAAKSRTKKAMGSVAVGGAGGRIFTSKSTAVDISATGRFSIATQETRSPDGAISGLIATLCRGLAGLFSGSGGLRWWRRGASKRQPVHHQFIPPEIELAYHPVKKSIEKEVGSADSAYKRIAQFATQMLQDIQSGKPLVVHDLAEVVHEVVESMVRNPDALMWVVRLKRQDTGVYGHGLQVAVYLVALGRHLGLPRTHLSRLGLLGLLLDIGKTKVPRSLLGKPGALTEEEFTLVKRHVDFALEMLRGTPGLDADILEGIGQHHEREDGSGYPHGLESARISLFGRMAGICDAFVAITNFRPYSEALAPYEAMRMLSSWSGDFFHVPLVEQFMQAVGVFPVGSLVELSTGEVAVVVRQSRVRRLRPRVLIVLDQHKERCAEPVFLDLLEEETRSVRDVDQPVYIRNGLPVGAYGLDRGELYLS